MTPLLPWELILIAHDLTSADWPELGLHLPKSLLESSEIPEERIIHGLVALLLIRIVALVRSRATAAAPVHAPQDKFAFTAVDSLKKITNEQLSVIPSEITSEVYAQLYQFVSVIAREYRIEPKYHNLYHAFHVTICCNKLLSILIEESIRVSEDFKKKRSTHGLPPTFDAFGLASDPLAQLALIFSAIIHDVDHRGITNQQLVLEGDELAIMYNDQSVAEQRSISLAFSELMRSKHSNNNASMKRSLIKNEANAASDDDDFFVYGALRNLIFGSTSGSSKHFLSFRRMVIDLVLTTDIANPERVQIVKSKYKEAFGANASSSAHPPKVLTSSNIPSSPDKASRSKAPFAEQQQKIPELTNSIRSTTIDVGSSTNSRERKKSLRQEFLESRGSARLTQRDINASSSDEEGHYSSSVPSSSAEDEVQLLAEGKANRNSMMSSFSSRSSMVTSSMKSSVNGAMRRKRRFSAPVLKSTYECRLGILRALNLTGSTVTLFSSHTLDDEDEDLQLKVGVLMELILKSSDVSNMLQGWDIYLMWSKRLFMEFCEAFEAGRGVDPRPGWFENQITFIDSYGMLLAKHLNEVKVFGAHGVKFIDNIQEIRRRWLKEGGEIVEEFMREWIMTRLAEQVADSVHVK